MRELVDGSCVADAVVAVLGIWWVCAGIDGEVGGLGWRGVAPQTLFRGLLFDALAVLLVMIGISFVFILVNCMPGV